MQLTPERGFEAVAGRLDRLQSLGISHLYLSPVTEAVPGSTHGYDVVDHARVRDELGGLDGLTALLDALAERGMAAVVDHVANHVSVERPELNPHWWALLRDGPGSAADRWFDIDWEAGAGKVLLPVLDGPIDALDVTDRGPMLRVGALTFPMAPGTEHLPAARPWTASTTGRSTGASRSATCGGSSPSTNWWRCASSTPRSPPPSTPSHGCCSTTQAFDGVRVDHVDGLADPAAYLDGLRELVGDRWLVVEKILAPGEHLPSSWPVDGTTGYEHARVLEHALLDPDGLDRPGDRWAGRTGDARPYREWELEARREVLAGRPPPGPGPGRDGRRASPRRRRSGRRS